MTTKPPAGNGLAADDSVGDSIEDILFDAKKPYGDDDVTLSKTATPPPAAMKTPAPTPAPLALSGTPGPMMKTPGPVTETPGPIMTSAKTPGPVSTANRDPSSVLPTIPLSHKEASGAFPLPGMAPPDGTNIGDDDSTLIARLSVLDDVSDESTKVEPLEAALRAKGGMDSSELTPINLGEQAAVERDKALSMAAPTALDRVSAAEFEDPGDDDDEMTVSATPGIISIEEDDEEPTASQRPPSARTTPSPVIPNLLGSPTSPPSLPPPGTPRLPAPTPVPGRTMHVPTPSGGLPSVGSGRVPPPAFSIPAPQGSPSASSSASSTMRSAVFKTVPLPLGAIVLCLVAVFGLGFVVGAYLWQGDAPVSIAADAPARAPAPPRTETAAEKAAAEKADEAKPIAAPSPAAPEKAAVAAEQPAPTEAPPVAEKPAAAEKASPPVKALAAEQPAPVVQPKVVPAVPVAPETVDDDGAKPARHVLATSTKPRPVVRKAAAATPAAAKPVAAATPPKAAAAPAKPTSVASTKPAKPDKAHGKGWVDPFAE